MRLIFCLLVLALPVLHAAEVDISDSTIVLGERVGLIKPGMTAEAIGKAYGAGNFTLVDLDGPEGSTFPGAKLFAGTDRELEIIWDEEKADKVVSRIRLVGEAWKFDNGLRLGMSLSEVETLNGKPFKVFGFQWDYAGGAIIEEGALSGHVALTFEPSIENLPDSVVGDRELASNDADLLSVKPVVAEISIFMAP